MNQHQNRIICRTLFYFDNLFNRIRIIRIDAQSIEAARGKDNDAALFDNLRRFRDDFRLGRCWVYFSYPGIQGSMVQRSKGQDQRRQASGIRHQDKKKAIAMILPDA